MRRFHLPLIIVVVMAGSLLAAAQSLGEVAREQRQKQKPPLKVYTNDNLPKEGGINVLGTATPDNDSATGAQNNDSAASDQQSTATPGEPGKTADTDKDKDKDKDGASKSKEDTNAALKASIDATKKDLADQQHELDLLDREFRLRAASYYADAGNSLRDPAKWAEERRQHDAQAAEKQKAIEADKQKLSDLEEQARRAGIPTE